MRGIELEPRTEIRHQREVGVGVGMIAQLEPVRHDPAQDDRMLKRVFADDEECSRRVFHLENIEHLGRPLRIRSIIKSQRNLLGIVPAGAPHHIGRRQGIVGFTGNHAGCGPCGGAVAGGGFGGDAQDFAIALDIGAL